MIGRAHELYSGLTFPLRSLLPPRAIRRTEGEYGKPYQSYPFIKEMFCKGFFCSGHFPLVVFFQKLETLKC